MEAYQILLDKANRSLTDLATGMQAVVLQAVDGSVHCAAGWAQDGQDTISGKLLPELEGKTVQRILCLWAGGSLDLPHIQLRMALMEQNPENGKAEILLQGKQGIQTRSLASTLPM